MTNIEKKVKTNSTPLKNKKTQKKNNKLAEEEDDNEEEKYPIESTVRIGSYKEAPSYLKDNEYIKNGYLLNCHSVKLVLRSLFVFSNESINIWSHLIGAIIAIILIFFTYIYITPSFMKKIPLQQFENIKIKVNETVIPWSTDLELHKNQEINTLKPEITIYLDKIIFNCKYLVKNYGTQRTIINIIGSFIDNVNDYINSILKIFTKNNNSNIFDDITIKWNICRNKLINLFKNDIEPIYDDTNNNHKVKRWPLFIMLSAAIVCLGCSTTFHWFGIYNKKVFSFLSRLDYAGITFLIPGSCYPPYFYFYYCEKCKLKKYNIFYNNYYL